MATKFLEPGTDATQDLTFWAATHASNGTIASSTTFANTGLRSLKSDITVLNGQGWVNTSNSTVQDAGARISFWLLVSTAAPTNSAELAAVSTAGAATGIIEIGLSTGGNLIVCGRSTTAQTGTTVLSANTWYHITFSYKITSTTNWSAKVFLNGVLEVSTSNTDGTLGSTGTSVAAFGIFSTGAVFPFTTAPVMTAYYDDIYIDNGTGVDDPGAILVTNKRPNANGTANNFVTQIGSGGSGYGTGHSPQVNEQPLSTTNGWSVVAVGSAVTEEYNIENKATGDVDIRGMRIVDYTGWVYTKALNAETGQIIVNGVSSNIAITTSNALFTQVAGSTIYPAGTGADIGETTDTTVTTVSLYECGILVAYLNERGVNIFPGIGF